MYAAHSRSDVLKHGHISFLGDFHQVELLGKLHTFFRAPLLTSPRHIRHSLFDYKKDQCAAYLIRCCPTGHVYAGSSSKIYPRLIAHKAMIKAARHSSELFAELLKSTMAEDYEVLVFFTDSREDAYELEQYFLDQVALDLSLNVARDVRRNMAGHVYTPEQRARLRLAQQGKKVSLETRAKLSELWKNHPDKANRIDKLVNPLRRRVSIDGVDYPSASEAIRQTGLTVFHFQKLLKEEPSRVFYLEETKSALAGRSFDEERRKQMSLKGAASEKVATHLEGLNASRRQSVVINGVLYPSIWTAVRATGFSEGYIRRNLRACQEKNQDGHCVLNLTGRLRKST